MLLNCYQLERKERCGRRCGRTTGPSAAFCMIRSGVLLSNVAKVFEENQEKQYRAEWYNAGDLRDSSYGAFLGKQG